MLKAIITGLSIVALGVSLAPAAEAQSPEQAVKARKGIYQNYLWHFGPMVAMAKGELEYDAERASTHAASLATLAPLLTINMFPEGSSNSDSDDTRALPAIWDDQAGFVEVFEAFIAEAETLAAVAGDGQAAMAQQVGATGEACGACHDDYRAER